MLRKLDESFVGLGVVKSVLDWEYKYGVYLNFGKVLFFFLDEMVSLVYFVFEKFLVFNFF